MQRTAEQLAVNRLLEAGRSLGELLTLIELGPKLEDLDQAEDFGREILSRLSTAQKLLNRSAVECAKTAGLPLPEVIDAICPELKRAG